MSYHITGVLHEISNEMQISEGFKKRNFVIKCSEKEPYVEYIQFELVQDKCSIIDEFHVGDNVEINFNIKGRRWQPDNSENDNFKYFVSLQAWRISKVTEENQKKNDESDSESNNFDDDNLPF